MDEREITELMSRVNEECWDVLNKNSERSEDIVKCAAVMLKVAVQAYRLTCSPEIVKGVLEYAAENQDILKSPYEEMFSTDTVH